MEKRYRFIKGNCGSVKNRENRRKIGADYEKIAASYLEAHGYEILEYNYRNRTGEIDLVAKEGEYLCFVEVKYRKDTSQGSPLEAVTWRKQQNISRVAQHYLLTHGYGEQTPCRFDVVGITGDEIELVRNAFEYIGR